MIAKDRVIGRIRHFAAVTSLLILAACTQAQNAPTKVVIDDVIPSGNLLVPSQRIVNMLKCKPGAEFKLEGLDADIRNLSTTKLFQDIRVQKQDLPGNKVRLFFLVREYPSMIQEMVFKGNKHLKPEELEIVTGMRKGIPLNPVAVQMGRQAILRRYNEMGRMLTSVEILEGDKPGDKRVVYMITEGQVAKVTKVLFEGNTFASCERLRSEIESNRAKRDLEGNYDPEKIEEDVHHLEKYYLKFGYADARVNRELIWSDDHREVSILFRIDEGIRYPIAKVKVIGTGPNLGGVADLTRLNIFEVEPAAPIKAPVKELNANEIQEKPPAKVGQIIIEGNDIARDEFILRTISHSVIAPLPIP